MNFFFSLSLSFSMTTRSQFLPYIYGRKQRKNCPLLIDHPRGYYFPPIYDIHRDQWIVVIGRASIDRSWKVVRCPQGIPISLLILPSQLASADSCPPRRERTTFHRPTTGKWNERACGTTGGEDPTRGEEKRPRPWSERKERKRDGPDKEGGPSGRSGASSAPLHELEESYVRELINK